MKVKLFVLIGLVFLVCKSYGQSESYIDYTQYSSEELAAMIWLNNLYDRGIINKDDSIHTSAEFQKALLDTIYREQIYPETYNWNDVLDFMKTKELKKAFWHLINLYYKNEKNKENVLKIMLSYIKVLEMDKVLVGTFYTYCFQDPEIGIIVNGKPEIQRPDILEAKLRIVREIVGYITLYKNKIEDEKK